MVLSNWQGVPCSDCTRKEGLAVHACVAVDDVPQARAYGGCRLVIRRSLRRTVTARAMPLIVKRSPKLLATFVKTEQSRVETSSTQGTSAEQFRGLALPCIRPNIFSQDLYF